MAEIDSTELGKWVKGETDLSKWRRNAWGLWYNLVPKMWGWTLSFPGLLLGTARVFCLLFLGLLPTAMKVLDPNCLLSWDAVAILSGLIVLALLFSHYHDKLEKRKKSTGIAKQLRQKLSLEIGGVTAGLSKILKLRNQEHLPELESATNRVLACVRNATRIFLGDYEGAHVEAALFLFNDKDCGTIRMANRTTSSRPLSRSRPCQEVMAYYVAKSRKHRIIDDFPNDPHPFPKTSLSGDAPSYRSILMIPLLDSFTGAPDTCVGVVTLDSTRPFHFWPGNGQDLVIELRPFLFLLALFVNLNEPHRLRYET